MTTPGLVFTRGNFAIGDLFGSAGSLGHFSETKVEDLHATTRRDHDVRRLDVAMRDALAVRFVERVCYLHRDVEAFVSGERPPANLLFERQAFNVFHRDEIAAICLANFINVRDVRMRQRRRRPCLLQKSMQALLIKRDLRRQNFHCN